MKWVDWLFLIMKSHSHGQVTIHKITVNGSTCLISYSTWCSAQSCSIFAASGCRQTGKCCSASPAKAASQPMCGRCLRDTSLCFNFVLCHYSNSEIQLWDNCFYLCVIKIIWRYWWARQNWKWQLRGRVCQWQASWTEKLIITVWTASQWRQHLEAETSIVTQLKALW